jgi:hypothetical protein
MRRTLERAASERVVDSGQVEPRAEGAFRIDVSGTVNGS